MGSATRRLVLLWALLIPAAYAPVVLVGARPGAGALLALAVATALSLGAALSLGRSPALAKIAATLDPVAGRLLALGLIVFAIISMAGAIERLVAYRESAMLGLFGQCYWTQLHGHVFANSQEALDGTLVSHFGLHFSPTLLVLLPFFALWPHALVLMAGQIAAVALAPVPLFLVLRRRVPPSAALLLALALLGLPAFTWSGFVDFRDSSFLPVLLLATVWALDARRWRWLTVFALATLGMREDAGLVLVALGVFASLTGAGPRPALLMAGSGLAWFALVPTLVMHHFWAPGLIMDPTHFFSSMFGQWGATPARAVIGVLSHPAGVLHSIARATAVRYLYGLLTPLLLLPPLADWAVLGALPGVAVSLLAAPDFMRSALQPYALVPLTFLALAAARAAARLSRLAPDAERASTALALGWIVLAGVVPSVALSIPSGGPPPPPAAAAARVVAALPASDPLYAPPVLYPYLFARETYDNWWNAGKRVADPEQRARYRAIVLWPASDPPGEPRDAALADTLAHDPRFLVRPGFEPFLYFARR